MTPKPHRLAQRAFPLFLLFAAAAMTACSDVPSTAQVRREIERQLPGARFQLAEHHRFGRLTLGFARWVVGKVDRPGHDESLQILRAVHTLEVATYKVRSLPELQGLQIPASFEHGLHESGWTVMLRSQKLDDSAWVLYRGDSPENIRDLYVVRLDRRELSLVRVSGELNEVMARALANQPGSLAANLAPGAAH